MSTGCWRSSESRRPRSSSLLVVPAEYAGLIDWESGAFGEELSMTLQDTASYRSSVCLVKQGAVYPGRFAVEITLLTLPTHPSGIRGWITGWGAIQTRLCQAGGGDGAARDWGGVVGIVANSRRRHEMPR